MNLFWLLVIALGVIQLSWVVALYRGKIPRKLLIKNWFNSTVWMLGFLAFITTLLMVMSSLGMMSTLVNWGVFYSSFDWITIESAVAVNAIAPYLIVAFLPLFLAILLRVGTRTYLDMALWKYTEEEIKFKKNLKADNKEKARKRLTPRIFKVIYPEKRKRPFKHPRLAKFFLMDIGTKEK